jgi:hypothetical protein
MVTNRIKYLKIIITGIQGKTINYYILFAFFKESIYKQIIMKKQYLNINIIFTNNISFSQSNKVSVVSNDKGMKLVVDGKDFMINGMNWDYYPIGTNILIVCGINLTMS